MMNALKINNKLYKYESFWRETIDDKTIDYDGERLPYPIKSIEWDFKDTFYAKLEKVNKYFKEKKKFIKYDNKKDCLLCDQKSITSGLFSVNRIRWEDGLLHYIKAHNIKPSDEFVDYIFRLQLDITTYLKRTKIKGVKIQIKNKTYLKLDRNQLLIIDALMEHGSKRLYSHKRKSKPMYSEHSGLLDFNEYGLEKIVVSGNTTRIDENDDEIFLPENMIDAFDYEYIFHTHPPTPKPGARAKYGILYEFPSTSDLFHFLDHYNGGVTQGSIIVAPEGMYIIRKFKSDGKKIKFNENKFYHEIRNKYSEVQDEAIRKHGFNFTLNTFYSKIAQDKSFIRMINEVLNKYQLHIEYYSRKKINNRWLLDTIYLPVYVVEPYKK